MLTELALTQTASSPDESVKCYGTVRLRAMWEEHRPSLPQTHSEHVDVLDPLTTPTHYEIL